MSVALNRELQTRVTDLEGALRHIGKLAADVKLTPKRRLERIQGVLGMFEALAPGEPAAAAPAVQS